MIDQWFSITSTHQSIGVHLICDMLLALALGLFFGYERSYHGRAAGMRTYGLVCMISAVLTAVSGFPMDWYGIGGVGLGPIDPTRTVQGIVTGIGFLGAGIIMKDGMNISGLTTAASIWAAAAIGVIVGLDYYFAATVLTVLSAAFVVFGARFEAILPSRRPMSVSITFKKGLLPQQEEIETIANAYGYGIAKGSISMQFRSGQIEWRFVAVSKDGARGWPVTGLGAKLAQNEQIDSFYLSRARN